MIFVYFLVILTFSGVKSQDYCSEGSVEEPEIEVEAPSSNPGKCSDGFTYFYRTPTPKNHQTSGWCLKLIRAPERVGQKDAENVCKQYGAKLSIFENHGEEVKMFETFPTDQRSMNVRIDGYRKEKCKTDDAIAHDPDCKKGNAFVMKSRHTDPTYIFNNWGSGGQEPNYALKKPDQNEESCLALIDNGHYTCDLSCLAGPPHWNVPGVLCGKKPE